MITNVIPQIKVISNIDPVAFEKQFNSVMADLADKKPKHIIDLTDGYKAVISYEETINIPDSIADEYHAEGIKYTCRECPLREIQTDGRKKDAECKHSPFGKATLKAEACEIFYRQLKLGAIEPNGEPSTYGMPHKKQKLTAEDIEILRKEETWNGKPIRRIGGQR